MVLAPKVTTELNSSHHLQLSGNKTSPRITHVKDITVPKQNSLCLGIVILVKSFSISKKKTRNKPFRTKKKQGDVEIHY